MGTDKSSRENKGQKIFTLNIKASITAVNSDQNQSRVRANIPRRSPPLGIYMYKKGGNIYYRERKAM